MDTEGYRGMDFYWREYSSVLPWDGQLMFGSIIKL